MLGHVLLLLMPIWPFQVALLLIALVRRNHVLAHVSAVLWFNWYVGHWQFERTHDQYNPAINAVIDWTCLMIVIAPSLPSLAHRLWDRLHRRPRVEHDIEISQVAIGIIYVFMMIMHASLAIYLWGMDGQLARVQRGYWWMSHWLTWGQLGLAAFFGAGGGHAVRSLGIHLAAHTFQASRRAGAYLGRARGRRWHRPTCTKQKAAPVIIVRGTSRSTSDEA